MRLQRHRGPISDPRIDPPEDDDPPKPSRAVYPALQPWEDALQPWEDDEPQDEGTDP